MYTDAGQLDQKRIMLVRSYSRLEIQAFEREITAQV